MQTMTEKDLVAEFRRQKEQVETLTTQLEEAKRELKETESVLLNILQADGRDRSSRYENIGSVTVVKPRVFASCLKENEPMLFDYLVKVGRDDLVKTTVNTNSLSAFVKDLLENGNEPPEFISYYLQSKLQMNKQ